MKRPGWLPPNWVALVSRTSGMPMYIDSARIVAITGSDEKPCWVYLSNGEGVMPEESAEQVMAAISQATR